jgi:hypothetical protein
LPFLPDEVISIFDVRCKSPEGFSYFTRRKTMLFEGSHQIPGHPQLPLQIVQGFLIGRYFYGKKSQPSLSPNYPSWMSHDVNYCLDAVLASFEEVLGIKSVSDPFS